MTGLSAEKLSFTYPNGDKMALDSVDIRVEQGDFAVLMGPSGCGKTTLLRHMKSALPPTVQDPAGFFWTARRWIVCHRQNSAPRWALWASRRKTR